MPNQSIYGAERDAFLEAMSRIASTVSVVTTDGPAGRAGATVSSLVSVSADSPRPTLLVCLQRSTRTGRAVLENNALCVNVLRKDHAWISDLFAGRGNRAGKDNFFCVDWTKGVTGAPRLSDSLAALDCRVAQSHVVGLHHVIFAEVVGISISGSDAPLLYANRGYATAQPLLGAVA